MTIDDADREQELRDNNAAPAVARQGSWRTRDFRDATHRSAGQDPRGAPDIMPIWIVLDMTPGGRGKDWYPKLSYDTQSTRS